MEVWPSAARIGLSVVMGRPSKAKQASRNNGAHANNKGKAVNVKKELFGGYSPGGSYVIKTVDVRRTMAKGEVRRHELGCEHDVFTFCLYHSKFLRFDEGEERNEDEKDEATWDEGRVVPSRWRAASARATQMLKQCADWSPQEKMAQLRKRTKGAKVRIKFGR